MDIWKHGKYVDTWSIIHFLSGFLLCSIFYVLGYEFMPAMLLSIVLLLVWEVFEWSLTILEPSVNVMMDIIIGLAGFLMGGFLYYFLNKPFETYYFLATLVVTALLSLWGFLDFLKKGYR